MLFLTALRLLAAPFAGLFFATSLLVAEDTLEKAKQELHPPAPHSSNSTSAAPAADSASSSSSHDHGNEVVAGLVGGAVVGVGVGIGYGAYQCFIWPGDKEHGDAVMGTESYPYHADWHGWYAPAGAERRGKIWGGEVYAETGLVENDLQRYAIGGRTTISAFTLRTEWNRFFEERNDGSHDSLTVGTIDLELGITITAKARLGLGLGATVTNDAVGSESGLCGVVALDVFPLKPITMQGVFTYGTVGDSNTDVMTVRGTVGVLWQRYEIYGGWQATRIGSVMLDGPTAGVRLWF